MQVVKRQGQFKGSKGKGPVAKLLPALLIESCHYSILNQVYKHQRITLRIRDAIFSIIQFR